MPCLDPMDMYVKENKPFLYFDQKERGKAMIYEELTYEEAAKSLDVQLGGLTPEQVIEAHRQRFIIPQRQQQIQDTTPYRGIPPKMEDTGSRDSNVERTGRRDLTVNHWARAIGTGEHAKTDNVRFIDGDLMEIHNTCKRVIVFLEASTDPERAVTFTKKLAESVSHTAYAMRVIHSKSDKAGVRGISHLTIWKNGIGVPILDKKDVPVSEWQLLMENLIIEHERTECAKF